MDFRICMTLVREITKNRTEIEKLKKTLKHVRSCACVAYILGLGGLAYGLINATVIEKLRDEIDQLRNESPAVTVCCCENGKNGEDSTESE